MENVRDDIEQEASREVEAFLRESKYRHRTAHPKFLYFGDEKMRRPLYREQGGIFVPGSGRGGA